MKKRRLLTATILASVILCKPVWAAEYEFPCSGFVGSRDNLTNNVLSEDKSDWWVHKSLYMIARKNEYSGNQLNATENISFTVSDGFILAGGFVNTGNDVVVENNILSISNFLSILSIMLQLKKFLTYFSSTFSSDKTSFKTSTLIIINILLKVIIYKK